MDENKMDINKQKEKNISKIKEEDRRFLLNVLNQNVQVLQSQNQFKITTFLSYTAIYISFVAVLLALNKFDPYFYIISAIYLLYLIFIFFRNKESNMIKQQTELYKKIDKVHFNYLEKPSKKKN